MRLLEIKKFGETETKNLQKCGFLFSIVERVFCEDLW